MLTVQRDTLTLSSAVTGPPGPAGDANVTFTAGVAIGGHRLVRLNAGLLRYMSNDQPADANMALGVSRNAAALGQAVTVQGSGLLSEPSWTWTPDLPVFCGINGLLTQLVPTAGFILVIGVAVSATDIIIAIKTPLVLQ